jgi:hypothetical protein
MVDLRAWRSGWHGFSIVCHTTIGIMKLSHS